jgi:hypothetical protein
LEDKPVDPKMRTSSVLDRNGDNLSFCNVPSPTRQTLLRGVNKISLALVTIVAYIEGDRFSSGILIITVKVIIYLELLEDFRGEGNMRFSCPVADLSI